MTLRRESDHTLAFRAKVYCTGSKKHDSFGIHKQEKAK